MDIFQAIILGIVQGITEFLPVSSSGHLVLVPWVLGWDYQGLSFDVAVHLGTLIGVTSYFWRDWREMIVAGPGPATGQRRRILFFIILSTIPAAVAGYALKDYAEGLFRSPEVVAVALIFFSFVMLVAEKVGKKIDGLENLNWQKVLVIGVLQACALVPGVSRAGATISAGLLLGLSRIDAAKFSFLLSSPIIFGAGILKFPDMLEQGLDMFFIIGVVTSAISGYFAIKFLFKFLERWSYKVFAWYRIVLGLVIFGLIWVG